MLPKSFILLAALGQALEIRKIQPGEMSIQSTEISGVITSVTVLEGDGCPAGSYQIEPFEAGKSPNTTVVFDPSIWTYNSTTSPGPVSCGVSFDFDFVIPEDSEAEISFGTRMEFTTEYGNSDTVPETSFIGSYDVNMRLQDEVIDGGLDFYSWNLGPQNAQIGGGGVPQGTPGETATGSFSAMISIRTEDGPGEMTVFSIAVGFGVYREYEWPQ